MRENSPGPWWAVRAVAGGGGNNAASSDSVESSPGRGGQTNRELSAPPELLRCAGF